MDLTRRNFIKTGTFLATTSFLGNVTAWGGNMDMAVKIGKHKLTPLTYAYNALEPHIDEKTLRIHHDKHHAGYVKGLRNFRFLK
jgi:hypothetical protein